jgi:hypothetical protein
VAIRLPVPLDSFESGLPYLQRWPVRAFRTPGVTPQKCAGIPSGEGIEELNGDAVCLAVEAAAAPCKLFHRFGCQEGPGHHGHEGDGELEGLSAVPLEHLQHAAPSFAAFSRFGPFSCFVEGYDQFGGHRCKFCRHLREAGPELLIARLHGGWIEAAEARPLARRAAAKNLRPKVQC